MDELLNFFLNHLGSVMAGSGGLIAVVMSVIQVSKIEINPWSQVATHIGNALNAGVMNEIKETKSELKDIRSEQEETRKKLDNHIEKGEETKADGYRSQVLRFNNELVRGLGHTEEDFDDILDVIGKYEDYCKTHSNYKNNKMPFAIKNVGRVYDEMLRTNGFLKPKE